MHATPRRLRARPSLVPTLAAALGAVVVDASATAQVRMGLHADMHLRSIQPGYYASQPVDQHQEPIEVNDFVAGDVDGDGDLDLVAATNDQYSMLWRNAGDGSFRAATQLRGQSYSDRCVAMFDADGDGDLDLLFGGGRTAYWGPESSELWRNDGTGGFTADLPDYTGPLWASGIAQDLGVGDMDGDGDRDVVVFEEPSYLSSSRLRYWRNDGTGTFADASAAAFPGGTTGAVPTHLGGVVFDVEGDGDLDVLTYWGPGHLYRNNGAGVFTRDVAWALNVTDSADMDGDGDLDLINTVVHRNDGGGTFTSVGSIPPRPQPPINAPYLMGTNRRSAVDMDGDGLLDLVGTMWSSAPTLLRNTGGFVFQDVSATWFDALAREPRVVDYYWSASLAFDADGDGRPDLVTGGVEGRGSVSTTVGIPPKLFVNSGGQRLVEASRWALPILQQTAGSGDTGDIDGDGDVDLVFGYEGLYASSPTANVYLQDEGGRFTPVATVPAGAAPMRLVDVDLDSDLDLLVLAGGGPMLPGAPGPHQLWRNDGTGQFTNVTATHMPGSAVSGAAACAVGDVDSDGDPDVVIGSLTPNYYGGQGVPLMLLRNDGTGMFSDASAELPPRLCQAGFVELADYDGDADLDLVVAADQHVLTDASGNPIQATFFFRNDGTGHFTDETAARIPPVLAAGLISTDLDGDGDLDLAQRQFDLRNDGSGVFTSVSVPHYHRIAAADFDEDGAVEFVHGDQGITIPGSPVAFGETGARYMQVLAADLDRDQDRDLVVLPMSGWGNPWEQLRIEVLFNLRRDLRVATLPRLGKQYILSLRAGNGAGATAVLPAVSVGRLPVPVPLPGLGDLIVDPATIVMLPLQVIPDADTAVEVSIMIPNDAVFLGVPLCGQALFGNGPAGQPATLSNAMTFAIER